MINMRRLSQFKPRERYVHCSQCKEVFIDDLPSNSLHCPICLNWILEIISTDRMLELASNAKEIKPA